MQREVGALIAALTLHVGLIEIARQLPPVVWPAADAPAEAIELELLEDDGPDEADAPALAAAVTAPAPLAIDRAPTAPVEAPRAPASPEPAAPADPEPAAPAPPAAPAAAAREPSEPAAPSPAPVALAPDAAPSTEAAPAATEPGGAAADREGPPSPPTGASPGTPDGWSTDEIPAAAGAWGALPLWARPEGGFAPSRGAAAPTEAPAAPAVDREAANRVLSSTLRARDKDLGISVPAAQVVVGAVADATRTVPVPHGTRASFEVRLDGAGRVTSARVIKSSGGDAQGWNRAAGAVASQLAARQLVMGEDGAQNGATVLVEVKTKHVYPAGTSKRADVKPVCANQIINDLAEGASRKSEPTLTDGATLFTDEHGRPCIPVGVAGISDVANLGANKQIQIETKVTVKLPDAPDLPHDIQAVDTSAPWVKLGESTAPRPTMPFRIRKREKDRAKKR